MRNRTLAVVALACSLGVAAPVAAQDPGTVDLGFYGRYTMLDDNMSLENAMGIGGRLGIFVLRNVAVEFERSWAAAEFKGSPLKTNLDPVHIRLAWHNAFSDNWTGILGAGWAREDLKLPTGHGWIDDGYSFLVGVQRNFRPELGMRLDLVADYFMSPVNETPTNDIENLNLGVQLGLNLRFGEQRPRDADGDGVPDNIDACPGTPAGEAVDATGCPLPKDADGDGVVDENDRCPNTPAGVAVDANGCPRDSDGDGVADNVDACPNTPAGTRVDARGCPVPVDSDGDGVLDNVDACPNTPAGTRVDARGCAIVFEEGQTTVVLDGVTFATGSADLTANAQTVLDLVAASLVNASDVNVEVQGHTDNTGSRAVNTRLSGERAESVRNYLISKGVDGSRLTARGYGPDQPIAPNNTADGRAQNRRVELKRSN